MLYKRTLVKATTWELSGVIILTIINFSIFGQAGMSFTIAVGYGILRIFMYYLHERIWKKFSWYKSESK